MIHYEWSQGKKRAMNSVSNWKPVPTSLFSVQWHIAFTISFIVWFFIKILIYSSIHSNKRTETSRDWFEIVSKTTRSGEINKPFPSWPSGKGSASILIDWQSITENEKKNTKKTYHGLKATNRFCIMSLASTLQAYIPQRCLCRKPWYWISLWLSEN